jgi:putative tryptophan/tyrosine transport system substrate-binding protein
VKRRSILAKNMAVHPSASESNLILLGSRTATLACVSLRKNLIFVGLILWHTRCVRSGLPMNKVTLWLVAIFLVSAVAIAEAQQPTKIPRIGFLNGGSPSAIAARLETFRQGLRELGYVEGKSVVIEHRSAEGKTDRLPGLAVELVRLKVDIIFSTGPQSTRAAKEATSTIPIVMGFDSDPVGNRFVASLARPGGNITGLSTLAPEISGKQLELLKEIVARLSRVAVFGTSTQPGNVQALKESELAAGTLGVKLQFVDILGPKDIEIAFGAAGKGRADAGLVLNSPVLFNERNQIPDLAVKSRLPSIYYAADFVEAGGLISYGASVTDLFGAPRRMWTKS